MRPLARQILIGSVVAVLALGALGATWWLGARRNDALAARLPAEAVLAYAAFPYRDLSDVYPSLPPPPPIDDAEALALVQHGSTVGWMALVRENGVARVRGTDPALQALLDDPRPSLAEDDAFAALKVGPAWLYVGVPRESPEIAGMLGGLFALDAPIAIKTNDDGFDVRFPLRPTPRLTAPPARPLVALPDAVHVLRLPGWNALAAVGTLFTDDLRTVGETLGATFLADLAPGLSLRHDASLLLDGPSILQLGPDGAFALEGTGRNAADAERVLRALHDGFGSTRGAATVKTVTVEGYVLNTLTLDGGAATVETTDGPWDVLETRAGDDTLLSARDGARFAVTNAPDAFRNRSGAAPDIAPASTIAWTDGVTRRFLPVLGGDPAPRDGTVTVRLSDGPGYAEWSVQGL